MTSTVMHFTDASAFGGAEEMIVTLLGGLDRERWNPILVHHGDRGLADLIDRTHGLHVPTRVIMRGEAKAAIRSLLRKERPAIFHAHLNWPFACSDALIAAALARTSRAVATQQLFVPIRSRRGVLRHKLLSLAVDRYIAVSNEMAAMLRRVCFFGKRKVRVVRNGVAVERFEHAARPDLRALLEGGGDRPIVLTLARLDRQKGIENLIEAAYRVPEALFAIAGEGTERAAFEGKARACGVADRVRFLGHRRDVPELLASCDLFVLPSLYEGFPVSVLEAMASAKPVIATRVGGTDEAVQDGVTGILVPPSDPTALARAIQRLLADPPLARRLATSARDHVRREFSAQRIAADTMQIYEDLVGETRSRESRRAARRRDERFRASGGGAVC